MNRSAAMATMYSSELWTRLRPSNRSAKATGSARSRGSAGGRCRRIGGSFRLDRSTRSRCGRRHEELRQANVSRFAFAAALTPARRPGSSISLAVQSVRAFCRQLPSPKGGRGRERAARTRVGLAENRTRPASQGRVPRYAIRSDAPSLCGQTSGRACFSAPIFCAFAPFGLIPAQVLRLQPAAARHAQMPAATAQRAIGLRKQKIGK
jgi:hypothetical protein